MAATCRAATSRRARAPPLVTPPRARPAGGAQPGGPLRRAPPPPGRAAARRSPAPRPAPGRRPTAPSRVLGDRGAEAGGISEESFHVPSRAPSVGHPLKIRESSILDKSPRNSTERTRCDSSGGLEKSFPNIRGVKKSLPHLSSSANRLSKNISSTTEKTVHQPLDDDQPCDFFKKGNRVNICHQKSSDMSAGRSWTKAQCSKPSSGKRPSKPQASLGASQLPVDRLRESVSPEGKPQRSPLGPRCRGASGNQLFLDLQCMKTVKADEDGDSASDLSDSERVPGPPSALAPPELHLRAEEIDAADPDPDPDPDSDPRGAQPTYRYADFLPAPFSSWDLRDLAVPPGAEPRPAARAGAAGLLARYIDRLLQLEWLQMQTVQGEKGKGAKARPPGAAAGAPKSPGRSRPAASAPARPHPEGAPRRRDLQREEARPSYYAFDAPHKALHGARSRGPSSQKPGLEGSTEEQRKKWSQSPRLRPWDPSRRDSGAGAVGGGGGGASAQAGALRDSCGAPRAPTHGSLQKKGSGSQATTSSEKKLKTNGVKPSSCRFK